jgi:hypothetical protein
VVLGYLNVPDRISCTVSYLLDIVGSVLAVSQRVAFLGVRDSMSRDKTGPQAMEPAPNSPPVRPKVARDPQRSRVTNGGRLLPGIVDERSAWVRRCKDLIHEHVGDLGGVDNVSVAERSIVRRAAVLTTELERLEAKFAAAGQASEADIDLYIRGAGGLRRLLESVGLQRRARDVTTPSIEQYAQHVRDRSEAPA